MQAVIVGYGAIGQMHARLLAQDGRIAPAGVVDTDPVRRAAFRQAFAGEEFTTLAEALASRPDAVFVTTPPVFHAEIVLEALSAGAAVFCEKPLATSAGDARRIVEAAARAGVPLQVGHNRRFCPAWQALKRTLDAGLRPFSAAIIKNDPDLSSPPWSADPAITGGLLFDGTIHALDAALWLFGPAAEVYCAARSAVYGDLDNLAITLNFHSGVLATITTCGHASSLPPQERIAIYGEFRAVVMEDLERVSILAEPGAAPVTEDFSSLPFEQRWGYAQQTRAFVDALTVAPVAVTAEDGLRVVELIEACYASARENRIVRLR